MKLNSKAQSAVEFMLVFVAIVVVVLLALAPQGFLSQGINQSLDESIKGLEKMASNVQYNVYN